MNTQEFINIALASDDNYAQHIAVVIASIMSNTTTKNICFYILSDSISNIKKDKIQETADSFGAKIVFLELSMNTMFDNFYTSGHLSKATYFRLNITNLVGPEVKKIIYMDVDIIVLGDVAELWNYNMHDYPVAATMDLGLMSSKRSMKNKKENLGILPKDNYFNAGILVIDVDKWRHNTYTEDVIKLASTQHYRHHDQDALNKVFHKNWQSIPIKWDVLPPVYNLFPKLIFNSRFKQLALDAKRNACIIHYAGRYKPWEFPKQEIFNDKYYYYLKLTAFKDVKMPQPSKNMKGKSLSRALWRLKIANFLSRIL